MSSIPASQIVQVNPGVLSAGGSALALNGFYLTNDLAIPLGKAQSFATAADVGAFYGLSSPEYAQALIYFAGFDNSTKKPARVWFATYNAAAASAFVRGASLAGMTLAQLQALTPSTISLTINGAVITSASVNLATATSFTNAAALIQTAFGAGANVTYDAQRNAFKIASPTTGPASTITAATASTMATGLKLTAATGAVLSQGAAAATPGPTMDALIAQTRNWALFTTIFEPVLADKLAFSAWTNSQGNRFGYVGWDSDANAKVQGSTNTWMAAVKINAYSGSYGQYAPTVTADKASFILGTAASIDFERLNGRITFKFRSQSGLAADVDNATDAQTLTANGYNYYGVWDTDNDEFVFEAEGQVSGPFQWMDTFVNQIQLNSAFQQALMTLLVQMNSIPYNQSGYNTIRQACMDPINAALNFGTIRPGVTLSASQAQQVNNAAGVDIATTLNQRGWYLQILDASPQVRQARGTPPMTFWYMDGGSVHRIVLASIVLQ